MSRERITPAAYDRATRLVRKHLQDTHQAGGKTNANELATAIDEGFAPIRAALKRGEVDVTHPLVVSRTPAQWRSWFTQTLLGEATKAVEGEGDYPPKTMEIFREIVSLWSRVNGGGRGASGRGATQLGEFEDLDEQFPLE